MSDEPVRLSGGPAHLEGEVDVPENWGSRVSQGIIFTDDPMRFEVAIPAEDVQWALEAYESGDWERLSPAMDQLRAAYDRAMAVPEGEDLA